VRRLAPLPGDGVLLRLLALGHALVGLVLFRRELRSIGRGGIVAAVPFRGPKSTAFWFFVPSPLVWIVGRMVGDAEAAGDWPAVQRAHRLSLFSATAAVLCMPVSGFWGWLAISARGLWRARKEADADPRPAFTGQKFHVISPARGTPDCGP
jgi:hypothetical protein